MKKPTGANAKRMVLLTFLLLTVGLLILYSASSVQSFKVTGNPNSMLLHQLMVGGGMGALIFIVTSKLDYRYWQKTSLPLFGAAVLLLLALYLPGMGISSGGATRWLSLGQASFQPGEIAKFAAVIYSAAWVCKKRSSKNAALGGVLPLLLAICVMAVLILKQPDMGTTVVLIGSVGFVLVAAGLSWKNLGILATVGVLTGLLLIQMAPYRAGRLQSFLNPEKDPLGSGYQINQALLSVGSGGTWGQGYGLSRQKHNYLPEAVGDSIFAVAAEELGLVRIMFVLALFSGWIVVGFKIAKDAPDAFGRLLAVGLVSMTGFQCVVNVAATIGLAPLTGIPLPFFSYGSSALIVTLAASGILVNIAKFGKEI